MAIEERGVGLDRAPLCTLPTPLVVADGLATYLRRPGVLIKRDDLTGLALGGNKTRSCEYVIGQAKAAGHDVVIAVGPTHSNQLCAITAAARKSGMEVILLLLEGDEHMQGNLLLFRIMGADVRFTGVDIADLDDVYETMGEIAEDLRQKGRRPLELRYGPLPLIGLAGYVELFREICGQCPEMREKRHHIFLGSGSGLTQAGLIIGSKLLEVDCVIHGVMVDPRYRQEEHEQGVLALAQDGAALLGHELTFSLEDVRSIAGYATNTLSTWKKTTDAIKGVARTEGFLLDPIYTGRVMAAMADRLAVGLIPADEGLIFYHSGGIPSVFSHCDGEAF